MMIPALLTLLAGCDPGQVEAPTPPVPGPTMAVVTPPAPDGGVTPLQDTTPAIPDTHPAPPPGSPDAGAAPPPDSQPASPPPAPDGGSVKACMPGLPPVVVTAACGEHTMLSDGTIGFRQKFKNGMPCRICYQTSPAGGPDYGYQLTECSFGGAFCVGSCSECAY